MYSYPYMQLRAATLFLNLTVFRKNIGLKTFWKIRTTIQSLKISC